MKNILIKKTRRWWILLTPTHALMFDMELNFITGERRITRTLWHGTHWSCFKGTPFYNPGEWKVYDKNTNSYIPRPAPLATA